MKKKGGTIEDLQKTYSNLIEEKNEYEKYGNHLKQEISVYYSILFVPS